MIAPMTRLFTGVVASEAVGEDSAAVAVPTSVRAWLPS